MSLFTTSENNQGDRIEALDMDVKQHGSVKDRDCLWAAVSGPRELKSGCSWSRPGQDPIPAHDCHLPLLFFPSPSWESNSNGSLVWSCMTAEAEGMLGYSGSCCVVAATGCSDDDRLTATPSRGAGGRCRCLFLLLFLMTELITVSQTPRPFQHVMLFYETTATYMRKLNRRRHRWETLRWSGEVREEGQSSHEQRWADEGQNSRRTQWKFKHGATKRYWRTKEVPAAEQKWARTELAPHFLNEAKMSNYIRTIVRVH